MAQTIEWQLGDGSGAVVIAAATDAIGDFRVNGAPAVQAMGALRAESMRFAGRGNGSNRISFLVTFAAAATAEAAKTDILAKILALSPATLTHELLEGVFGTLVWQLSDCALESYEFSQSGVTIYGRFSFIGGALTDETPA